MFLYNSGKTSYLAGNLDLAIHEFDQAIELKPDYADAYFGRGLAHLSKLEYNLSIIDLSQAISIKPAFVEAYYYRGTIYANQTSYDKAIADLTQAIQLDIGYTPAYFSRGGVYLDIENYESAVADYSEVIEQEPSNAVAYNNRCWSYFKQGKYELALPDCERSLVLAQDDINTLDSRARVYLALGDTEKAIADFERIIELNPDSYLAKQAERELAQLKGVTTNPDDSQTPLMPANVELSQLEGEWTGLHTLTAEGACSLGASNSATSPVSMWWEVNQSGAVEIKIEDWPGFPYTFVGQVKPDMNVSLELSTEAMCSGNMVLYTANFSGIVQQEDNTLKLDIEALEVWCPPDCVFRRQFSISHP